MTRALPSTICYPIPRNQLSRRPSGYVDSFHDTFLLAVLCHIPPSPVLANEGAVAMTHINGKQRPKIGGATIDVSAIRASVLAIDDGFEKMFANKLLQQTITTACGQQKR
jgi:hypothetical protein